MYYDLFKDLLVILIVFLPPLIYYCRVFTEKRRNSFLLAIICIVYIVAVLFLQNTMPFVAVVLSIITIKSYYRENRVCSAFMEDAKRDYARLKFSFKSVNFAKAFSYAIGTYFISIIISLVVVFIMQKSGMKVENQQVIDQMEKAKLIQFLFMIPVAVIFAPVVEEFVFRYLLFDKVFKNRTGVIIAAIISSLMFGVVHFNIKVFVTITFIGLVNCYLIEKEGFWYSVFNHMFFNLVPITSMFVMKILGKTIT